MQKAKFRWTSYVLLILFAAFIWGYSAIDVFMPSREYSEMENRYLTQVPSFSFRSLFNNTYTIKIEEFTNDQFALRDAWITLKSLCETALGKIENNGVVYGKDNYMFEKRLSVDEEQFSRNTASMLEFLKKYDGNNLTLMLVPTSDMILTDKLPKGLHNIEQEPVIDEVYAKAEAAGANTVDLFPILRQYSYTGTVNGHMHTEEYVYYRTDHHWTTFGAYLAYTRYMESLGLDSQLKESPMLWEWPKNDVTGFYGTYYSKTKLFNAVPDIITWYDVPVKSVTINNGLTYGMYDLEKFDARDKYAAFLHGNNAVTVIESDCNLNRRDDGKRSKVLLIKDSFGNSFAPFLCRGFDEVTVVDLRYLKGLEQLMTENQYDEVLVLYSFPSFMQETSLVNLKL